MAWGVALVGLDDYILSLDLFVGGVEAGEFELGSDVKLGRFEERTLPLDVRIVWGVLCVFERLRIDFHTFIIICYKLIIEERIVIHPKPIPQSAGRTGSEARLEYYIR
jgi:hypothetical protein